jgi:IclR family KDG regulon transcriptional repressor
VQHTYKIMDNKIEDRQLVRTLARGLQILDVLKDRGRSNLTEISMEVGLDKSTVHRLLYTLTELGFIERNDDNQKYRLAVKLIEHGRRAAADMELRRVALPYLKRLREASGETASFSVLDGGKIVWVEMQETRSPLPMTLPAGVGAGWPHATASGKAIMAYLPAQAVERLLPAGGLPAQTKNTITTVDGLREDLSRTRERGYALDDIENIEGLRCIAVPLFGPGGRVLGAISISAPAFRFSEEVYLPLVPVLKDVGLDISRSMGADERSLIVILSPSTAQSVR